MKLSDEDIDRWEEIIEKLHALVNEVGEHECCSTRGECSIEVLHAIIHINMARDELENAIKAINKRIKVEKVNHDTA
jgi:hypothetical protein